VGGQPGAEVGWAGEVEQRFRQGLQLLRWQCLNAGRRLRSTGRSFYEHLIPEFERSPTDPLHLLLLLKDIRRTLGR
jgi:hypothetical protein